MVVSDAGKLIILALIVIGLFGGLAFGDVKMEEVDQYFLFIIGYLTGNGVNAVRKKAPTSVLTANVQPDEVITIHGSYPIDREKDEHEGFSTGNP